MPLTTVSQGLLSTDAQYTGFKNRIINGAMQIDQRNAGASVTPSVTNTYTLDRWNTNFTQASKFSVQQSTVAPAGFTNSLAVTTVSAVSVGSGDLFALQHIIEGLNVADLGWGTANAQPITLSFQVRSSLTGTFGGVLGNSAHNRSYPFTFTISSANTYETKTITIPGDTTGTWLTNNGAGIRIFFNLGSGATYSGTAGAWSASTLIAPTGATSVVGTNGATFYITGVQLEKGSTATSFDYRPYGTELALCQRYCINYKSSDAGAYVRYGSGYAWSTLNMDIVMHFPVTMRASPSLTVTSTASNYALYVTGSVIPCNAVPVIDANSDSPNVVTVYGQTGTPITNGYGGAIISNNNTTSYMLFTAEL
jgi:hypothetical protein